MSPLPQYLADLTVADLRHLAAAIEARSTSRRAVHNLSHDAIEELADMFVAGTRPTIGWFAKHRPLEGFDIRPASPSPGARS